MANGVLILCDDLIFTSKIAATARAHGMGASVARTQGSLITKLLTDAAACVIVDLHNSTLDWAALFPALGESRPRFVGFGSHVDKAALDAARSGGCDLVMPRSQFVKLLETDLPKWAEA